MKEREALQKALKAIDLLITADNMSSFETSILTDDMRKEVMEYQIAAQQALEQSEDRLYSEEEVIGFGIWLGEKYWFNLSTYKWECRNEEGLYEVLDSKRLIELYIQSLSPKEGKGVNKAFSMKLVEELQPHWAKIEPSLEPNQTEAEKVLEKYFPNPDDLVNGRVKSVIVKAMEEYATLARQQVIEEIEGWMNELKKNSTEPITHLAIPYTILLTKLSKLK